MYEERERERERCRLGNYFIVYRDTCPMLFCGCDLCSDLNFTPAKPSLRRKVVVVLMADFCGSLMLAMELRLS
jgi:hypothetical protein